jgi:hypothetical protein
MDLIKLTLDRFFGIVAGVIPGAAVLMIIGIHHPDWVTTVRDISFLGYGTKVGLALAAALVAGWTVLAAYNTFTRFVQGMFWDKMKMKDKILNEKDPELCPWRQDPWRSLMKKYLGDLAPQDLVFIDDAKHQANLKGVVAPFFNPVALLVEQQRLTNEMYESQKADLSWKFWWDHLHSLLLVGKDPVTKMLIELEASLQATSLLILLSMYATPVLYHWWILLACMFWIVMRVMQTSYHWTKGLDPWETSGKQIHYLRERILETPSLDEDSPLSS